LSTVAANNQSQSLIIRTARTDKFDLLSLAQANKAGAKDDAWRVWKFECHEQATLKKNWQTYIKKTETFFPILPNIVDSISGLAKDNVIMLPSQMVKAIDVKKTV
jgi:hypothetical protein